MMAMLFYLMAQKKMFAHIDIINSTNDAQNVLSATNVDIYTKTNESHITSSESKNDVFRYIMEDINESLSEDNKII